ncbi:hypothetical protein F5Y19DRAFT_467903 [Xylariaceae sp. FL1651]|nr:hypothetical protein F5Y19DRAFT_467903 [Xylariaceae sp. FL1651]
MSWMDSWSRPSKSQATPAPYYLLPGGESTPYCRSCGRVISARRAKVADATPDNNNSTATKYCSARCRIHKPRKLDRDIEATFVQILLGQEPADHQPAAGHTTNSRQAGQGTKTKAGPKKSGKGDPRILVSCDEVERLVFGDRSDPEKTFGRKKNRASRVIPEVDGHDDGGDNKQRDTIGTTALSRFLDDEDQPYTDGDLFARLSVRSGTRVRPAQNVSEVNGSVGGEKGWAEKIEETEEMARRRIEGQKRAQQKEMVRCAARRGVVFGFIAGDQASADGNSENSRRKCEAVMQGKVVEPSFAKGDWAIRWRE